MTKEQWRRAKELFGRACELPSESREQFLRTARDNDDIDAEVIAAVRNLLDSDGDSARLISPLGTATGDLEPGMRIGPYTIERLLGHGGMGRVYLALRSDGQFHQQVAIKVLRSGPSGGQLLLAALREQRLLARLNHPNIARIIDAGLGDGRTADPDVNASQPSARHPFIVMEYVDGESLLDYCERTALPLDRRLALFQQVCEAVQHAHQNLVLHRDLKPDNILVTAEGQPKLLDFGIAKLLQETSGVVAPGTATIQGWSALTPEYASPEQVRGEPLTTATDVYALGVILYQLLCGQRPYVFEKRSPEEVVRVVTETTVTPPSIRAAPRRGDDTTAAPEWDVSTPIPARLLRGDLDTIVAQAMHRDPGRRYPSAQSLAQDLENFRCERPVAARADSAWYRIRKFVQRQTLPVAITAVAVVLVTAGIVLAWTQNQARLEEARRGEALSRFMFSLFDSVTPSARQGEAFTVSQLLEIGSERASTELAHEPEALQRALLKIAETHIALGNLEQAQATLERAREQTEFDQASRLGIDAMALQAWIELLKGRGDAAIEGYRQALALQTNHYPREHKQRARIQARLASALIAESRLDEAESQLLEAIAELSRPPAMDPREAQADLAQVYQMRGDLAHARQLHEAIIASSPQWDGGRPTMALAQQHHLLALNLTRAGSFDEALSQTERAIEILQQLDARDHPNYPRFLVLQAYIYHVKEDLEAALAAAEEASERMAAVQPDSSDYRQALGMRADVLKGMGRYDEAISVSNELADLWRAADVSDQGRGLGTTLLSKASAEYWAGYFDDSLRTINEALEVLEQSGMSLEHRPRYNLALRMQAHAVQTLVALGDAQGALRRAQRVQETFSEIDETDSIQLQARFVLALWHGAALEVLGREDEAQVVLERAAQFEALSQPGMIAGERDALMRFRATGSPLSSAHSDTQFLRGPQLRHEDVPPFSIA